MRTADDVRRDPKVGDVAEKHTTKRSERRSVVEILGTNCVFTRVETARTTRWISPTIAQWRRWAKDAEVLHVAE